MRALGAPLTRPVGTAAVYAAVLGLGLAALPGLPLGLAPDLEPPRLSVFLSWPDASPEEMEALVTARVEGAVSRLRDVEEIASMSGAGYGFVDVVFERKTDMDIAEVEVRDALAALADVLPPDLDPPDVRRVLPEEIDPGAFFVVQLTGGRTPEALRELLDERVLPALSAVPGVSGTQAYGGGARELRVDLDRAWAERSAGLAEAAGAALARVGPATGVGVWRDGAKRTSVVISRPQATPAGLADRLVERGPDTPRRALGDVARVVAGWERPRALARLDGKPSVQGVLEREPGTNVVRVATAARTRLDEVERALPDDVVLTVVHDESESIRRELGTLARRSSLSLLLVASVLVVARRGIRAPLVVMTAVLFSAVATFLLFRAAGLGFNLITLSGLALSFGLSVDNAIVLIENVALRTRGRGGRLRTLAATREVLFPLVAATATTAVVMTPFLYLNGELRDVYLPFVLAVVLSLVASLVVALTLVPALARWALRERAPRPVRRLAGLDSVLRGALRFPAIPIGLSAALLAASIWVFIEKIPKGSIYSPQPDTTLRVALGFPPGTDITRADHLLRRFEDRVLAHEFFTAGWIEKVEVLVREDQASLSVRFLPALGMTTAPAALQEELTLIAATVSGADVSVSGDGPGFQHSRSQVSPSYVIRVSGPEYERVKAIAAAIGARLEREPRIRDVDTNGAGLFVDGARELVLVPDRTRLAEVGLTMRDFVTAVRPAIADEVGSRRLVGPDGEVTARVRFAGADEFLVAELRDQLLRTPAGTAVAVGAVADIEERDLPGEIRRRDQRYERTVSYDYRGPRRVGDRFTRSLVENTSLPPGYEIADGMGFFLTREERRDLHFAIALAVGLVLIVSAALFESVALPFVAVLAIPLSFTGIPFAFWAMDETFDRTAYVGLILLAGIAVNNALLLVHRAGQLRSRGVPIRDAARRATLERARPVLLTTATSVVGLLPLVWAGTGAGPATWRAFALAATAGLAASAAFTLVVIPCLFTWIARPVRPFVGAPAARVLPVPTKGEIS